MTRYIWGEDPASQDDFFGIVIHEMPSPTREIPKPVPRLRDLYKLNHTSFDKIIEFHTDVLFKKWPSFYMVFDYTNERTFTDMMVRDWRKQSGEGKLYCRHLRHKEDAKPR
ncbi:MAG: hypothetical protein OEM28_03545 [Nitrosopumilus sp.]|nr:hypothetical protein [Nitrosopumilus sp.]MDH3488575.1 hypothetical protein [Nitrosopumilus sp.]